MFEAATIQAMPKINWGQRDGSAVTAPVDVFAVDAIGVCPLYLRFTFAVPTARRSAYDSRPDSSKGSEPRANLSAQERSPSRSQSAPERRGRYSQRGTGWP